MRSRPERDAPAPRLVPREGKTRVRRIGARRALFSDLYVRLLDAPWYALLGAVALLYLVINSAFAAAYLAIGNGIENARSGSLADAFFFSVQTMATIGYGKLVPVGIPANILVTIEALLGFCFFALVTGLGFAKFSRPTARVLFSRVAVISNYDGVPHFMFRVANERANRIVNATVSIVVMLEEVTREGYRMRRFHDLKLLRSVTPFIQLSWSVMHRIDEKSPLYGLSRQELTGRDAEIIVTIAGMDETLAQTIHARHSFIPGEILFDHAFEDILDVDSASGVVTMRYDLFHSAKPVVREQIGAV